MEEDDGEIGDFGEEVNKNVDAPIEKIMSIGILNDKQNKQLKIRNNLGRNHLESEMTFNENKG